MDLRNGFSGLKTARFGLESLFHRFQDPKCDSRTHSGSSNLNCTINSGAAVETDVNVEI